MKTEQKINESIIDESIKKFRKKFNQSENLTSFLKRIFIESKLHGQNKSKGK